MARRSGRPPRTRTPQSTPTPGQELSVLAPCNSPRAWARLTNSATYSMKPRSRPASSAPQELDQNVGGEFGLFERERMARALNHPQALGALEALDISGAVSARHHAVRFAPDHHGRHGGAMEAATEHAVIKVGRSKADKGAEAQHLIAPHLVVEIAAAIREIAQSQTTPRLAKVDGAQRRIVDPALRLRMHEHIRDWIARHEQPAGSDQSEPCNTLRVAHRNLGRDPSADAMADEIESRQPERIKDFE